MAIAQMTIGEIAAHLPAAMPVFEKFHIDYSCGGSKSLARACRDSGAKTEEVVFEIEHAQSNNLIEESVDWTNFPISDLIDHIVRHHHWFTWAQLPRLEQLLGKLLQSFHPEYPNSLLVLSGVFRGLRLELEDHMMKEQTQVFPLMTALEKTGSTIDAEALNIMTSAINSLVHEHEISGQALKEMHEVARTFCAGESVRGACTNLVNELEAFEQDLHVHIHLETNILFPRVRKLIAERPA